MQKLRYSMISTCNARICYFFYERDINTLGILGIMMAIIDDILTSIIVINRYGRAICVFEYPKRDRFSRLYIFFSTSK